ncbi:nicotinamide mononucleotide transporter [bacterium]|nr:nicotinamide mononucleotide transporter [bacterium]
MKFSEILKKELNGWGRIERIIFPLEILLIIIISLVINDDKIALISAICGISYTILAGKGKISCYFFGLAGTLCYSFISLKNQLYGNLALYAGYFLPMQIIGIFKWKKHLKVGTNEIIKTSLTDKERIIYLFTALVGFVICYSILLHLNDRSPVYDSVTLVFSVIGQILTVKRCIEQWYVWLIVNGVSSLMWIDAYLNGSNCFATIIMWITYFILAIYFLHIWKKELNNLK